MKTYVSLVLLWLASAAIAHDLITPQAAERYLEDASRWHEQSVSALTAAERAKAHVRIGMLLDEIREFLNRDVAMHGKVQGLASNYLVAELKRAGTPLTRSEGRANFLTNAAHYRAALALGITGSLAQEAKWQLLRGEFYDSFDFDPLQSTQTREQLREHMTLAEDLVGNMSAHPNREEMQFIATFVYARVAKSVSDAKTSAEFRNKALMAADEFERQYPDSLRSAAMPVVRNALQ